MTRNDDDLDPVAVQILDHLASDEKGRAVSPETLARAIADHAAKGRRQEKPSPNAWRRYFQAVKDQAFFLARTGRVQILRKGEPVAPEDLKSLSGIWRVRLPGPDC